MLCMWRAALHMAIKNSGWKKYPSWKGSILSSLWNVHQISNRAVCLLGDWWKLQWRPLAPLPVIWKRSLNKNWPLLWCIHDITCQSQGPIGIFGELVKQSYREKSKAVLSLHQIIQDTVLFVTAPIPLICQIHSLNAMFLQLQFVMQQFHDWCQFNHNI